MPNTLRDQLFRWLGGVRGGLPPLDSFDLRSTRGVTAFLLQYAGLTWDHLQQVLVQQLGAGNYAAIQTVVNLLSGFDPANPSQIGDFVQQLPGRLQQQGIDIAEALGRLNPATLPNELLNRGLPLLQRRLLEAVPSLLAKFIPGANFLTSFYQGLPSRAARSWPSGRRAASTTPASRAASVPVPTCRRW